MGSVRKYYETIESLTRCFWYTDRRLWLRVNRVPYASL